MIIKKLFAILIVAVMLLSLAACGGKENKPSGNIADIGDGGANQSTGQPGQSTPGENSTGDDAKPGVEIKSDRVVSTADDGMGNTAITEYIYKDGSLSEIVMTIECADAATAKTLLESYTTGSLKDYGSELYADMKQDGSSVVMVFKENYLTTFSSMTMEQIATLLEGGDPFSGSAGNSAAGGSDSAPGETKINTAWTDMSLPVGFPKLAEGATNYSSMDSFVSISWNTMSKSDAEAMVSKLESWTGVTAEKTDMDGVIGWHMDNGKCTVDLSYYSDTFGGVMDQVMLSIMIFE